MRHTLVQRLGAREASSVPGTRLAEMTVGSNQLVTRVHIAPSCVSLRVEAIPLYQKMLDEELVNRARGGDECATEWLLRKYRDLVRIKTQRYFLAGADREDIRQEGMIGLYKAIRDFDPEKLATFRTFAEVCITRQVITAIEAAARQKHVPLNSYVSFNKPIDGEGSGRTLLDTVGGLEAANPEALVIDRQVCLAIQERIRERLSDLEHRVLAARLEGKSYEETAARLRLRVKTVDNALQRIKSKLERGHLVDTGAWVGNRPTRWTWTTDDEGA